MDKYQQFILSVTDSHRFEQCCVSAKTKKRCKATFNIKTDTLTIFQDEDIFSKIYYIGISAYIKALSVLTADNNWQNLELITNNKDGIYLFNNYYRVVLDFDNRITKLKITFNNDIAQPYILDICYIEADKEEYYKKEHEKHIKALISAANINVATGVNLVNIYFSPCCEQYFYTEIDLFRQSRDSIQMMATYSIDKDQYFIAIKDLARGNYCFILRQFDKENKLLFQTDTLTFSI